MFRLDGKIAVVTGAGSGIGRAIANTFTTASARVFVLERDTSRGGNRGEHSCERWMATAIACDVASAESVEAAFGGIDWEAPVSASSSTMPASRISEPLKTPARAISIASTRSTSRDCFFARRRRRRG